MMMVNNLETMPETGHGFIFKVGRYKVGIIRRIFKWQKHIKIPYLQGF